LLMCLLIDHGLRVGEIALLTRQNFDLKAGTMTFKRPKVKRTKQGIQTHELTADTRRAAIAYIAQDAPADGILWRRSCKGTSKLSGQLSAVSAERALTKRVEFLGRKAGLEGLSAHDCRHYWATYEARNNTPVNRLMDAGGWSSPAMPLRYIEAAHIANEGTARIKAT
jgi:integrase